jgi:hypothetical protein
MTEPYTPARDDDEEFKLHPFCAVFPRMSDDELATLVADMKIRGYDSDQPITLMSDGSIIDGRNRAIAAERANVAPSCTIYKGDDILSFARSRNLNRRHLTTDQRSMIAAKLVTMSLGGDRRSIKGSDDPLKKVSLQEAAETMNVGRASVIRARKVQTGADNIISMVDARKVGLPTAALIVQNVPKEKQEKMTVEDVKQTAKTIRTVNKISTPTTDPYNWPCIPKDLKDYPLTSDQEKIFNDIKRYFKKRADQRVLILMLEAEWEWMPPLASYYKQKNDAEIIVSNGQLKEGQQL